MKSESFPYDDAKSKAKRESDEQNTAPRHQNPKRQAEQRTTTSRQYGESDQNPITSVKTIDDLKTKQNTIKKLQSLIEYDP